MKKSFRVLGLLFLAGIFVSCKEIEFNLQAKAKISSDVIRSLFEGTGQMFDATDFDYSFYEIPSNEAQKMILQAGDFEGTVDINLVAQIAGFSLKKIYAKNGTIATGYIKFLNGIPLYAIEVYNKNEKSDENLTLDFLSDGKTVSYKYKFPQDASMFDSEKKGNEIDVSEKSNARKNMSIKFKNGKIIIDPAKNTKGFEAQIILSKIKTNLI